jgi:ribosomal protein S18 acetylase RimI-like enzyme
MAAVRPLLSADIPAAAAVAARAFQNNPVMVAIIRRDEAERSRLLTRFNLELLAIHLRYGRCWVVCEGERVLATMLTLPSGAYPLPLRAELKLFGTSLRFGGLSTTLRFARLDAFVKQRHPSRPHHYLYMIATDPACQRRGLGSMLLGHLADEARGTEIYLETDEPQNLPFYAKNGYEVLGEALSPIGEPRFPLWFLRKL